MRNILSSILLLLFVTSCVNSNSSKKSSYKGPPMFILTEMNGRELEDLAYFTIHYDNTFELKLSDGTVYKYTPTKHFGNDPLCNILAVDDLGRNTAICIKKINGGEATIMLENEEMISNFKGYTR